MKAKDVMTTDLVTVKPDTPVAEIAKKLIKRRISAVPVIDGDGHLVGIVSENDLIRRPETGGERQPTWWLTFLAEPEALSRDYMKAHGATASDVMTRELITVDKDTSLEEIATLLEKHRIKRVPVVQGNKLLGIVSRANLLQGLIARQHAPKASPNDQTLRERVLKALGECGARIEFINVVVSGGVIQLWGAAYSDTEHEAIRAAVKSVAGSASFENHVGLIPPAVRRMLGAV